MGPLALREMSPLLLRICRVSVSPLVSPPNRMGLLTLPLLSPVIEMPPPEAPVVWISELVENA